MSSAKLDSAEIEARLASHPDWTVVDGKLHRELRFDDFVGAFSFMTAVALAAESSNHHPEWFNVYNQVRIDLATHDAGGITDKDFDLASVIDRLVASAN